MHEHYFTPVEWHWNWLNVIPKKMQENGIPLAADLRPLELVDSVRRLWIGIIDRKLTKATDKYDVFSQAQRGSRKNSGTDDALTYLQAVLEEAKRT